MVSDDKGWIVIGVEGPVNIIAEYELILYGYHLTLFEKAGVDWSKNAKTIRLQSV